ncbi:hypothetical protein Tcan_09672 [Toxocara canis]|uniref:ARID domain-containing protein n=1 Tax=Toxocara canis TaxID=6265 RepID=A0A0B2UZI3_TOXCA|nr:hypothetical protein Tcan_09672 [Toxocara canis]
MLVDCLRHTSQPSPIPNGSYGSPGSAGPPGGKAKAKPGSRPASRDVVFPPSAGQGGPPPQMPPMQNPAVMGLRMDGPPASPASPAHARFAYSSWYAHRLSSLFARRRDSAREFDINGAFVNDYDRRYAENCMQRFRDNFDHQGCLSSSSAVSVSVPPTNTVDENIANYGNMNHCRNSRCIPFPSTLSYCIRSLLPPPPRLSSSAISGIDAPMNAETQRALAAHLAARSASCANGTDRVRHEQQQPVAFTAPHRPLPYRSYRPSSELNITSDTYEKQQLLGNREMPIAPFESLAATDNLVHRSTSPHRRSSLPQCSSSELIGDYETAMRIRDAKLLTLSRFPYKFDDNELREQIKPAIGLSSSSGVDHGFSSPEMTQAQHAVAVAAQQQMQQASQQQIAAMQQQQHPGYPPGMYPPGYWPPQQPRYPMQPTGAPPTHYYHHPVQPQVPHSAFSGYSIPPNRPMMPTGGKMPQTTQMEMPRMPNGPSAADWQAKMNATKVPSQEPLMAQVAPAVSTSSGNVPAQSPGGASSAADESLDDSKSIRGGSPASWPHTPAQLSQGQRTPVPPGQPSTPGMIGSTKLKDSTSIVDKLVGPVSSQNPQHVMADRRAFFEKLVLFCERQVTREKTWKHVCTEANSEMSESSAAGYQLRRHYQKYLLGLECFETGKNLSEMVAFAEKLKKRRRAADKDHQHQQQQQYPGPVMSDLEDNGDI